MIGFAADGIAGEQHFLATDFGQYGPAAFQFGRADEAMPGG